VTSDEAVDPKAVEAKQAVESDDVAEEPKKQGKKEKKEKRSKKERKNEKTPELKKTKRDKIKEKFSKPKKDRTKFSENKDISITVTINGSKLDRLPKSIEELEAAAAIFQNSVSKNPIIILANSSPYSALPDFIEMKQKISESSSVTQNIKNAISIINSELASKFAEYSQVYKTCQDIMNYPTRFKQSKDGPNVDIKDFYENFVLKLEKERNQILDYWNKSNDYLSQTIPIITPVSILKFNYEKGFPVPVPLPAEWVPPRNFVQELDSIKGLFAIMQRDSVQTGSINYQWINHQYSKLNDDGKTVRFNKFFVNFPQSFSKIPRVAVSLYGLAVSKNYDTRIVVVAEEITVNGFYVVLCTWADTQLYEVDVNWIATVN